MKTGEPRKGCRVVGLSFKRRPSLLLTLNGNFGSWHAPSTTVFLAKKGEGAVSVGGIWFLSAQASVKVWGRELERKRLCKDFTVVGLLVFFEALWVSEPGSGLGCAIW